MFEWREKFLCSFVLSSNVQILGCGGGGFKFMGRFLYNRAYCVIEFIKYVFSYNGFILQISIKYLLVIFLPCI